MIQLAKVADYNVDDPNRNSARDISPKRKVEEIVIDPEEEARKKARELYRQWRNNIFKEHERTTRRASHSSEKARKERT